MMPDKLKFPIDITQTTPLHEITLYEKVPADILNKIIHSKLTTVNSDGFSERTRLQRYYKNYNRGLIPVTYKLKDGLNFGRVNPIGGLGLHSLRRPTRHTLIQDHYADVDIVNAHAVMLQQLLKANDYEGSTEKLNDYINNREAWFAKLSKRFKITSNVKDICKNLIIRISYGGSYQQWQKDNNLEGKMIDDVIQYANEMSKIHKFITESNVEIYNKVKEIKQDNNNLEGKTTSYVLQYYENMVLENIYQYCIDESYVENDICSLCNDGILLEKHLYHSKIPDEFNAYVKEQIGLDIKFIQKPMTETYRDKLDDNLIFDIWKKEICDGEIAQLFQLLYSTEFIAKDGFGYWYNGVYWEKSSCKKNNKISTQVDKNLLQYIVGRCYALKNEIAQDLNALNQSVKLETEAPLTLQDLHAKYDYKLKKKDPDADSRFDYLGQLNERLDKYIAKIVKYLRNVRSRDSLVKDIVRLIENDRVEFDQNPYLIAFDNKVYDLEKGAFVKPEPEQYISMTCGWKWTTSSAPKKRKINKILDEIFVDKTLRKHYLINLSTGCSGIPIQKLFVSNGVGANGKSWLNNFAIRTLGDYGYKLQSSVLTKPLTDTANNAVAKMRNKRLVLTSEPDREMKITTSTVKEMTGGGTLNSRDIFQSDNKTKLALTLLMECNALPALDETTEGVIRRIDVTPFESRFLTQDRYEVLQEKELNSGLYFKANIKYDEDKFKDEHKQALMEVFFEHFAEFKKNDYHIVPPPRVKEQSMAYIRGSDDVYDWFSSSFTEREGSILDFKEVYKHFTESHTFVHAKKEEKRTMSQKWMKEQLRTNQYLKGVAKDKGEVYEKEKISKFCICGYDWKTQADLEEENVYDICSETASKQSDWDGD